MDVEIRKFKLSDLKELLEIEKFSFPKAPYTKETFLAWYRIAEAGFFVAIFEKKIVGYIIGYSGDRKGILVSMAIYPSFRRKSIGTKLWYKLLKFFKEKDVKNVCLEVRKSNVIAQKFYERLGFKRIGIYKSYYEDGEDAISMECNL